MRKKKRKIKDWYFLILVLVMFVAAAALIFYAYFPSTTNCGYDVACFMENANACKPALLKVDYEGSILEYRSTKDCVLIKKIVKVSSAEPKEVQEFLEGKKMACDYAFQDLNNTWIDNFSAGLSACKGELKDAISNLQQGMEDLNIDDAADELWARYNITE